MSTNENNNNNNNNHDDAADPQNNNDPALKRRHDGILMHPKSISQHIVPGNMVWRPVRNGKSQQKRDVDIAHGYFWMIRDLRLSNDKPIQTNETLIAAEQAKVFPDLYNLETLASGDMHVDVPDYFLRQNRTLDAAAQCTLVTICFREFGRSQLSSWTEPFRELTGDRVQVMTLQLQDGWIQRWFLQQAVRFMTKRNVPIKDHSQSLMWFGKTHVLEEFRDSLRMHNLMTGYVFLLDGLGRVRAAGSGKASTEEADRIIAFAKELLISPAASTHQSRKSNIRRYGKRVGHKGTSR